MNQNHVLDSSFSAQLLPVGLNVVIEDESDYVFVCGDDDIDIDLLVNKEADHDDDDDDVDDDIDWDEGSYDHCDLSPSLSCATSVATNVTLKDLNLDTGAAATTKTTTGDANIMATTMVMDDPMDVDEDVNGDCGNWNSMLGRTSTSASVIIAHAQHYFAANPKGGRRLSNKKLRKKMKNMKKAAAARALAEQKAAATSATTTVAVVSSMSSSSSSEDETKMKKPRAVSIDCT